MVTTSTLAAMSAIPEDVQAVRCALYNTRGIGQFAGLKMASVRFASFLKLHAVMASEQLSGVLDKKQRLAFMALGQTCVDFGPPFIVRTVPEGTLLSPGNVILTIESTDERFPWLPLLFADFIPQIESASTLSHIIYRFKTTWNDYIEESVDPDLVEIEKHLRLRVDIEPVESSNLEFVGNSVFPHYPIPLSMEPLIRQSIMIASNSGKEWLPWQPGHDRDYNEHKVALHSNLLLDRLGYKPSNLVEFFSRYKDSDASVGIEYTNGYFKEEIPTMVDIAKKIAKELDKAVYVKLEGKFTTGHYDTSPINGDARRTPSNLTLSHTKDLLHQWFHSFSHSDFKINSKGYKVAPVKLLWKMSSRMPTHDLIIAVMKELKLSAENIVFYTPSNIGDTLMKDMHNFEYSPVAWKVDDKWKALSDKPANPVLFYEESAGHFTADPDDILYSDKADLIEDSKTLHGGMVMDTVKDFLHSESAEGPITVQDLSDPLLM